MHTSASHSSLMSTLSILKKLHMSNTCSNIIQIYTGALFTRRGQFNGYRSTAFPTIRPTSSRTRSHGAKYTSKLCSRKYYRQTSRKNDAGSQAFDRMLRAAHLPNRAVESTPLEAEILNKYYLTTTQGSPTSIDVMPRGDPEHGTTSHDHADIRAQNLQMLDFYDDTSYDFDENISPDSVAKSRVPSGTGDNQSHQNANSLSPAKDAPPVVRINAMLLDVGLQNPNVPRQLVFDLYSRLPRPGLAYLKRDTRERLMERLSQVGVKEKNEKAMMQYLSAFDDLHLAGIKPRLPQWAAAMHLSGRCFKKVTSSELESAMRLWRRMEEEAGISSNTQTMNVLLDIALKADQLSTAEMIVDEMRRRKLKFSRATYLGIIYLHGLSGNGDGIRSAYKDFVEANEVVDTMTLTCVISAFLKADELPAAMNVYHRMLARSSPQESSDENSPRQAWALGRQLLKFSTRPKGGAARQAIIKGEVSVRPNLITYVNLISYHARRTGEIVAIATLLDEMHAGGAAMHGAIFIELFQGFSHHGNKMFTSWTRERLEEVYKAFKSLADSGDKDVFVGPVSAVVILGAFNRCFGRARTLEVFAELRSRWRVLDKSHEFDEGWLKHATGISYEISPWLRPEIQGFSD